MTNQKGKNLEYVNILKQWTDLRCWILTWYLGKDLNNLCMQSWFSWGFEMVCLKTKIRLL